MEGNITGTGFVGDKVVAASFEKFWHVASNNYQRGLPRHSSARWSFPSPSRGQLFQTLPLPAANTLGHAETAWQTIKLTLNCVSLENKHIVLRQS